MNIKTLEQIHKLLVKEEEKSREIRDCTRKKSNAAEDGGTEDAEQWRKDYDFARKWWRESFSALEDFEAQEW